MIINLFCTIVLAVMFARMMIIVTSMLAGYLGKKLLKKLDAKLEKAKQ